MHLSICIYIYIHLYFGIYAYVRVYIYIRIHIFLLFVHTWRWLRNVATCPSLGWLHQPSFSEVGRHDLPSMSAYFSSSLRVSRHCLEGPGPKSRHMFQPEFKSISEEMSMQMPWYEVGFVFQTPSHVLLISAGGFAGQ